jgi:hypothetical protein
MENAMMDEKEVLFPGEFRQAFRLAANLLLDDLLTCVVEGESETDASRALDYLPSGYRLQIEGDLRRWVVAFTVAGTKLAEDQPLPSASVAESLAMHAILSFAADILDEGPEFGLPARVPRERVDEYRDRLDDILYIDMDFMFLYGGWADGIGADPEEPIGQVLGTVNLAYADWFRGFPGHQPHPYFDEVPDDPGEDDCPFF